MALTRIEHWATRELHDFLVAAATSLRIGQQRTAPCLRPTRSRPSPAWTSPTTSGGKYADETSAFALIAQLTGGTTVADAAALCAAKHGPAEWDLPLKA